MHSQACREVVHLREVSKDCFKWNILRWADLNESFSISSPCSLAITTPKGFTNYNKIFWMLKGSLKRQLCSRVKITKILMVVSVISRNFCSCHACCWKCLSNTSAKTAHRLRIFLLLDSFFKSIPASFQKVWCLKLYPAAVFLFREA